MGRKSKNRRKREEEEEVFFCFYCDRDFKTEKVLIEHQRSKHFKCEICFKRLVMAKGLMKHMTNIHKQTLNEVPNAMDGRKSLEFKIYGMSGIPDKYLVARGLAPSGKRQCVPAPPLPGYQPQPYMYNGGYPPYAPQQMYPPQMMYPPQQQMGYPPPPGMMMRPPAPYGVRPPQPWMNQPPPPQQQQPTSVLPPPTVTLPTTTAVTSSGTSEDKTVRPAPPQQQILPASDTVTTEEKHTTEAPPATKKKSKVVFVYKDKDLSMEERRAMSSKYVSPIKQDTIKSKLNALDSALQERLELLK